MIFQTVIDQVHLLHEKEEWHQEITDEFGAITELPDMFGAIVSESVQVLYCSGNTFSSLLTCFISAFKHERPLEGGEGVTWAMCDF